MEKEVFIKIEFTGADEQTKKLGRLREQISKVKYEIENQVKEEKKATDNKAYLNQQIIKNQLNLKELQKEYAKQVNEITKYSSAMKTSANITEMSLGEMKKAIMDLKRVSFAGKTPGEIDAIKKKIGELNRAFKVAQAEAIALGEQALPLTATGMKVVAAGVEAVVGSMALMGVGNETLEKMQKNLLGVIAVTQALSEIEEALEKRRLQALVMKIKDMALNLKDNITKWASVTATTAQASAEGARAVMIGEANIATKAAAAAQWLWNKAILANPIGLIIAGITALVGGIMLLVTWMGKNKEHLKALQEEYRNAAQSTELLITQNSRLLEIYGAYGKKRDEMISKEIGYNKVVIGELEDRIRKAQEEVDKSKSGSEAKMLALSELNNAQQLLTEYKYKNILLEAERSKILQDEKIKGIQAEGEAKRKSIEEYNKLTDEQKEADKEADRKAFDDKLKLAKSEFELSKHTKSQELRFQAGQLQEQLDYEILYGNLTKDEIQAKQNEINKIKQNANAEVLKLIKEQAEKEGEAEDETFEAEKKKQADLLALKEQFNILTEEEINKLAEAELAAFKDKNGNLLVTEEEYQKALAEIKKKYHKEEYHKEELDKATDLIKAKENLEKENADFTFNMLNQLGENRTKKELKDLEELHKKKAISDKNYEKKKEELERKEFRRHQLLTIAKIWVEAYLGAMKATASMQAYLIPFIYTIAGMNSALVLAQKYAKGKYDVIGDADGQSYSAVYGGRAKTGLVKSPTLFLAGEKAPEIVIDGDTTRNLQKNYPAVIDAINRARVPQYAKGFYDGGYANITASLPVYSDSTKDLINAIYNMPSPVVTVQDINIVQRKVAVIEQRANI